MNEEALESILLCSGGLDSTTLAYWLQSQNIAFVPLFLDYGQHCANKEYETLFQVLPKGVLPTLVKLDLSAVYHGSKSRLISEADLWTEEVLDGDLYLPYRNLFMLTVAAAFAQSRMMNKVYAGFINSNRAKEIDCSMAFFAGLGELLGDYGVVRIEIPFREMSKYEVARLGIELGAPIAKTFSCQASSMVPCGACPNCVERLDALSRLI